MTNVTWGGGATPTVSPASVPVRAPRLKMEGLHIFSSFVSIFIIIYSGVTWCLGSVPARATSEAESAETAPQAITTSPTAFVSDVTPV